MNKTGSNTGHLTLKKKVHNFYFFYFVLVLNTIWKDFIVEKQMKLPYESIYASYNMAKFCDFSNFAKITIMNNQLLNAILCLEAKYAQICIQIQLSHLSMILIKVLDLINLGACGRLVIGAVL